MTAAKERELRRRCRTLLRTLDIRPPLNVTELCRKIGERRGKPIRLVSRPIPVPGPFGVWMAARDADYILYQQETSKAHQDHIIVHELGHILAGHTSDEGDDDLLHVLYPDIAPDAVRKALRRTGYNAEHEHEAETVATIILAWASVLNQLQPTSSWSRSGPDHRLDYALRDRLGWL